MSRTIALTGATGFIGGVVARQLQAAGWQLRLLVRPAAGDRVASGLAEQWVEGTLEDLDSLQRLVQHVYAVVHCAGAVRGITPAQFEQVNVDGVMRLARVATEQRPIPRFLSLSSLAARQPDLSPYAASKRQGEQALAAAAGKMPWMALRPPAVYGPGDRELLPLFLWMGRGIAPLLGSSQARFSMLYVEDLAAAVLRWLEQDNIATGVFELHDGQPGGYNWQDVTATAARLRAKRIFTVPVPASLLRLLAGLSVLAARMGGYAPMLTPGKVCELRHPDWVCDNSALSQAIGWKPQVSLEEGLRRTYAWADRTDA